MIVSVLKLGFFANLVPIFTISLNFIETCVIVIEIHIHTVNSSSN